MKNLLLITIIALTVACSKDESSGLKMNSDGIYTITNSSELNEFNSILESDSTARCVLAYAEKESIALKDIPNRRESVYGVNLPNCTTLNREAFAQCDHLTDINLPKCTSAGMAAFMLCESITTVNLPECTNVGSGVFAYCKSLTTINLPMCTSIGDNAFSYWSSLENLSLLSMKVITTIPTSLGDQMDENGTFGVLNTKEITLTLNANGKEKDNIKEGNIWKNETWKEIILK